MNSTSETTSIVFASTSGQFYHKGTIPTRNPGLISKTVYHDKKLGSIYRDFAKTTENLLYSPNWKVFRLSNCKGGLIKYTFSCQTTLLVVYLILDYGELIIGEYP